MTQDPTVIRRADAFFEQGRALFDLGHYEEACAKFELSMQLDPSPGTSLNLGNCYEAQGDLVRGIENFERAFDDAQRRSDPRRKRLWTEAARKRIASLSPRVPQLSVRNVPPAGRLSIDQRPIEDTSGALRINPGRHVVEVSAPGKRPFRRDVDIATGQRLAIDVPELEANHPPETAQQIEDHAPPPRQDATRSGDRFGPWPYVLSGAGIGLLATSLGTGLAANAKENKLVDECVGNECPLELEGTRDSAKTLALMTDIFWVTGLIATGVGVTLFVLESQDETTSADVEAGCFGSGCGVLASGHF
jgi:tetratricopeptide (TPR) repeat protein